MPKSKILENILIGDNLFLNSGWILVKHILSIWCTVLLWDFMPILSLKILMVGMCHLPCLFEAGI